MSCDWKNFYRCLLKIPLKNLCYISKTLNGIFYLLFENGCQKGDQY